MVGGLQDFSVSPKPLGYGFSRLRPGLDNYQCGGSIDFGVNPLETNCVFEFCTKGLERSQKITLGSFILKEYVGVGHTIKLFYLGLCKILVLKNASKGQVHERNQFIYLLDKIELFRIRKSFLPCVCAVLFYLYFSIPAF